MTGRYRAIAGRIRGELPALERVARRAESSLAAACDGDDRYIDAAALNLHALYSGIERLFELVARQVDDAMPEGPNWHTALLGQMAADINGVRPPVLSSELSARLDRYRGSRQVVRNVYTFNLDEDLVGLPETWRTLASELSAFADFLDAAGAD